MKIHTTLTFAGNGSWTGSREMNLGGMTSQLEYSGAYHVEGNEIVVTEQKVVVNGETTDALALLGEKELRANFTCSGSTMEVGDWTALDTGAPEPATYHRQ
ncbi:MAG: hypothetical protein FWD11_00275 [Micrococcales bacterium]|nr:hypothetical protein [Micrococcales bacterium]